MGVDARPFARHGRPERLGERECDGGGWRWSGGGDGEVGEGGGEVLDRDGRFGVVHVEGEEEAFLELEGLGEG